MRKKLMTVALAAFFSCCLSNSTSIIHADEESMIPQETSISTTETSVATTEKSVVFETSTQNAIRKILQSKRNISQKRSLRKITIRSNQNLRFHMLLDQSMDIS